MINDKLRICSVLLAVTYNAHINTALPIYIMYVYIEYSTIV